MTTHSDFRTKNLFLSAEEEIPLFCSPALFFFSSFHSLNITCRVAKEYVCRECIRCIEKIGARVNIYIAVFIMVNCINEIRLVVVTRLGIVRAIKLQIGCSVCMRIVRRRHSNINIANPKKEKKEKRVKCYKIAPMR